MVEEQQGLPIAEVSRRLGVPMPTLRSWELRYGIPTTGRLPGRHRRYTAAELHAVRLMRDQIARGTRAAPAAEAVRKLLGTTGPAAGWIDAVLRASQHDDAEGIAARLDESQRELGLGPSLDDVLLPALQQVGSWWETGRCTVESEHLTTETARSWLKGLLALAPEPDRTPPIVLACGPSDLHTVGLEALEVLLRHDGFDCRMWGAQTPVQVVVDAVTATGAGAAVIVSHLSSGRARAVESLRAAVRAGATVFYAGNAFTAPRSRRNVPGTFLGPRLQDAGELIETALA